jgi:hypothetical protein
LATGNEHDFEPDKPVDGRAEASPERGHHVVGGGGVTETMRRVDTEQKEAKSRRREQLRKPRGEAANRTPARHRVAG